MHACKICTNFIYVATLYKKLSVDTTLNGVINDIEGF